MGDHGLNLSENENGEISNDGMKKQFTRIHSLKLIHSLQKKLQGIRDPEKSSLCFSYVDNLEKLKQLILKNKSSGTVDRCEKHLIDLSSKVQSLEANEIANGRYVSSPDSTEVLVDLTTEKDIRSVFYGEISDTFNDTQYIPDSTVEIHDSGRNSLKELMSTYDENAMNNSPVPHRTPNTIFSQRRPKLMQTVERANSSQKSDPIKFILQTARSKASCESSETENQSSHLTCNSSYQGRSSRIDTCENVRAFSNCSLEEDGITTNEIEQWEGHLKPAFYGEGALESHETITKQSNANNSGKKLTSLLENFMHSNREDDHPSVSERMPEDRCIVAGHEDGNHPVSARNIDNRPIFFGHENVRHSLSGRIIEDRNVLSGRFSENIVKDRHIPPGCEDDGHFLSEKVLENRQDDLDSLLENRLRSGENSVSTSSIEGATKLLPNFQNTKLTNKISTVDKKERGPRSAREKLTQEIEKLHKMGVNDKITPSLKQLKSDIRKLSSSSSRSKSPSPVDPYRCSRSPKSRGFSDSHSRFDSRNIHKYSARPDYHRDSHRSKFSSPERHSPFYSGDPRRSRESRENSSTSPKRYSPKGSSFDNSKFDKSHKLDESKKDSRPYSSNYRILDKSQFSGLERNLRSSASQMSSNHEHSNPYQSFIDTIGGERTINQEQNSRFSPQKNTDAKREEEVKSKPENHRKESTGFKVNANTPEKKPFKKSTKFKIDTNLPKPVFNSTTAESDVPSAERSENQKDSPSATNFSPYNHEKSAETIHRSSPNISHSPRIIFPEELGKRELHGIDSRQSRICDGNTDPRIDDRIRNNVFDVPRIDDRIRNNVDVPRINDRIRNNVVDVPRIDDRIRNNVVDVSRIDDKTRNDPRIGNRTKNVAVNDPRIDEKTRNVPINDPRLSDRTRNSNINDPRINRIQKLSNNNLSDIRMNNVSLDPRIQSKRNYFHPGGQDSSGLFPKDPRVLKTVTPPTTYGAYNPVDNFRPKPNFENNSYKDHRMGKLVTQNQPVASNLSNNVTIDCNQISKKNPISQNQLVVQNSTNNIVINCNQNTNKKSVPEIKAKKKPAKIHSYINKKFASGSEKKSSEKVANSENIQETIKSSNTFYSPLQNLFTDSSAVKTGKGYGVQKPKKPPYTPILSKFTIPKLNKKSSSDRRQSLENSSGNDENDVSFNVDENVQPIKSLAGSKLNRIDNDREHEEQEENCNLGSPKERSRTDKSMATAKPVATSASITTPPQAIIAAPNATPLSATISASVTIPISSDVDEEENWDNELIDVEIIETNNEVIEIVDSDEMERIATPPRTNFENSEDCQIKIVAVSTQHMFAESSKAINIDELDENREFMEILDSTSEKLDKSLNSQENIEKQITSTKSSTVKDTLKSVEITDFQVLQKRFPSNSFDNEDLQSTTPPVIGNTRRRRSRKSRKSRKSRRKVGKKKPMNSAMQTLVNKYVEKIKPENKDNSLNCELNPTKSNSEKGSSFIGGSETGNVNLFSAIPELREFLEEIRDQNLGPVEVMKLILTRFDADVWSKAHQLFKLASTDNDLIFTNTKSVESRDSVLVEEQSTHSPKRTKRESKKCESMTVVKNPLVTESCADVIIQPRRKYNRELDSLHADIEKMKNTKNNIFTAIGIRSCRSKPTNYTDRQLPLKTPSIKLPDKKPIQESDSESDDIRIGIRRTRSKAGFDSESDESVITPEKRANQRLKAKNLQINNAANSNVASTSAVSGNSIQPKKQQTARKNTKQMKANKNNAPEDISKSKPCPRRVKIQHFGSRYEQYEINVLKTVPKILEPLVRIPKLPLTCDRENACFCQTSIEISKALEAKIKTELNAKKNCKNKNSLNSSNENAEETSSVTRRPKNAGQSSKIFKRKPKTKLFNLRMKLNGNRTWQLVRNKNKQRRIRVNSQSKSSINNKKVNVNVPVRDEKDDSKAEVKEAVSANNSNDLLDTNLETLFVPRNAFNDANITSIAFSSIEVQLVESKMTYTCSTGWCSLKTYTTDDSKLFYQHLKFLHKEVLSQNSCSICGYPKHVECISLIDMTIHIIQNHLKMFPVEKRDHNVKTVIRVKQESLEEPKLQESTANCTPNINEIFSQATNSVNDERAVANAPKIRVRRFSGDLLSGPHIGLSEVRQPPVVEPKNDEVQLLISAVQPIEQGNESVSPIKISSTTSLSNFTDLIPFESNVDTPSDASDSILVSEGVTLAEKRAMFLWKCAGEDCLFATNQRNLFARHLNTVHRSGGKRIRKHDPACLVCIYCKEKFKTPEMLMIHMKKYSSCNFQCAYCSYRAYRPVYLKWHQETQHQSEVKRILVSSLEDIIDTSSSESTLSLGELVLPFHCIHCNAYKTFSVQNYIDHWKNNHSQTNSWSCQQCDNVSLKLDIHLRHLKLHGLGEYQCIYCLTGTPSEEFIKLHLMQQHRTLPPKAVKRQNYPTNDSGRLSESIDHLDFDEPRENFKEFLLFVNNVEAPESAFNESEPSASVRSVENMDGGLNTKTNDINQNENVLDVGDCNEDVIALDSDDEDNNRLIINETEVQPLADVAVSAKRRGTSIIGLSGVNLYRCGFAGCSAVMEDYSSFKEHLPTCDNARDSQNIKCPHCNRCFIRNSKLLSHIVLHGVPRYLCTLCEARFNTPKKTEDHLKQAHKVIYSKMIPANPLKHDQHTDFYIIVPDVDKNAKGSTKHRKTVDNKVTILASTANDKLNRAENTAKPITTVYCFEDVEKHLPMQLFSEPVTCGICSTYKSKVRSNIIVHLKCHSTGLVPDKDITNPVPCMEKSELMFNKMTNHAAFSAKNEDKRIKTLIEKVEAFSGDKNEIIPGFVPKPVRFSCCAPDCGYLSTDASRLKEHWDTLHQHLNFNCPHCGVIIPTEKLHTHFRYHDGKLYKCLYCSKVHYQRQVLEKHQLENHAELSPSIQIIRELTLEEIEDFNREARYQFDPSFERDFGKLMKSSRWKCNLCRMSAMASEQAIQSHCMAYHRVSKQYKCCLCNFADKDKNRVNTHMNENHESISQVVITVYTEICSTDGPVLDSERSPSMKTQPSVNIETKLKTNATCTETQKEWEKYEESKSSEKDSENEFVLPLPNNRYKCKYCQNFDTTDKKLAIEHMYRDNKYFKYVCITCGYLGISEEEVIGHSQTQHEDGEAVQMLTPDERFELEIENLLNFQESRFSQVNKEANIENAIEISDSSSDEDNSVNNMRNDYLMTINKNLLHSQSGSNFICPRCEKVCSSKSGLTNHYNSVHLKKPTSQAVSKKKKNCATTPNQQKWPKTVVSSPSSVKGVYPCPFCQSEFESKDLASKHMYSGVCLGTKDQRFPAKTAEKKIIVNRNLECWYCGEQFEADKFEEHNLTCPNGMNVPNSSKIGSIETGSKKKCDLCSFTGDELSFVKHMKSQHEVMECLNCNKVFNGTEELERHLKLSYASRSTVAGRPSMDFECKMEKKNVVFMCPYCPFGSCGQTYDKYLFISNHIRSDHIPGSGEIVNIFVKINKSKRKLLETEIALMQSRYNKEQMKAVLPKLPVKRNVALKSTSKTAPSFTRQVRPPKISRLENEFESPNESNSSSLNNPKFNIFYGRKSDYDLRKSELRLNDEFYTLDDGPSLIDPNNDNQRDDGGSDDFDLKNYISFSS